MKKVFKKSISLLLSLALVLSAMVGAASVSADTATADDGIIHATPIDKVSVAGMSGTKTEITPIPEFTVATGYSINSSSDNVTEWPADKTFYFAYTYSNDTKNTILSGSTGFLFYVKTNTDNIIELAFTTPPSKYSWDTEYHMNVGAGYSYMSIEDGNWITGTTIQASEKNANWRAGIKFDAAFEGWIKVPFSSFANDANVVYKPDEDIFKTFTFRFAKVGGQYGEVICGPVMKVTQDSASATAKIDVPAEYKPATEIKAEPITNTGAHTITNSIRKGLGDIQPLPSFTTAKGYEAAADSVQQTATPGYPASGQVYIGYNYADLPMSDATGLLFYLKLDSANAIAPMFGYGKSSEQHLGVGKTVSVKAIDSDIWTEKTAVEGNKNSTTGVVTADARAQIKFDGAFEGWVKIPFSSFVSADTGRPTFAPTNAAHTFRAFLIRYEGVGGSYGNVVFGPVMKVTEDTPYYAATITIPDEYKPAKEIQATPLTPNGNFSPTGLSKTIITPIPEFTTSEGYSFKHSNSNTWDNAPAAKVYTSMKFKETEYPNGASAILLYVEKPSGGELAITFNTTESKEVMLSKGKECYIKSIDSENWEAVQVADATGNTTNAYKVISLDEGFKGFIKIPFSSLTVTNGVYNTVVIRPQYFTVNTENFVLGPVMVVTQDTPYAAATITIPDEYKPAPAKATALTGYTNYYNPNMKPRAYRIEGIGALAFAAKSWSYSGVSEDQDYSYDFNYEDGKVSAGDKVLGIEYKAGTLLGDIDSIMFYVKAETNNTLVPTFGVAKTAGAAATEVTMKVGSQYQLLAKGASEWADAAATVGRTDNGYFGAIDFDAPFEGWVKIPIANLGWDNGTAYNPATHTLSTILFRMKKLAKDEEIIIGAYFTITGTGNPDNILNNMTDAVIGDIDGDGDAASADILMLRDLIFSRNKNIVYDINLDESVNVKDLVNLKKRIA